MGYRFLPARNRKFESISLQRRVRTKPTHRRTISAGNAVPTWDRWFESISLQRRVLCEPDSLDQDGENLPSGFKLASSNSRRWRKNDRFDLARLERLERRLQALEDAAAIRNLKARYAALCDAQYDADGIALLFIEDALWESPDLGRFEGREAIRGFFRFSTA